MPSETKPQAKLMAGVAHGTIKNSGVPPAVAKEFNQADAKTGILRKKKKKAANDK